MKYSSKETAINFMKKINNKSYLKFYPLGKYPCHSIVTDIINK